MDQMPSLYIHASLKLYLTQTLKPNDTIHLPKSSTINHLNLTILLLQLDVNLNHGTPLLP